MSLTKKEAQELLGLLSAEEQYYKYQKIGVYFGEDDYITPDGKTIHCREKYPKHVEFFNAGNRFSVRAIISANQTGKSLSGCVEDVYHATGDYPSWWKGKRFNRPVTIWLCGDRAEAVRDSLQVKLIGNGTNKDEADGLIPKDRIIKLSTHSGVSNCISQYFIKHKTGGTSTIVLKTYQSGRTAFEASVIDVIHLDEECPRDIFSECMTRTAESEGIVYLTFTPDSGLTDTVQLLLSPSDDVRDSVHVTKIEWNDVPHLSEKRKKLLLSLYTPQERECRSKGIPYLGSGKIYQTLEEDFVIKPFEIPRHWPRVFGMDVGYKHPTAMVWGAWDREADTVYIYSEYKAKEQKPSTHANAIIGRGNWIPGIIDTSAENTSATDGKRLIDIYNKFGLKLHFVKKGAGSVEAGILEINDRLESGRVKLFNTCVGFLEEYRIYRRNDKGQIVKLDDDLMDAWRYLHRNGLKVATVESDLLENNNKFNSDYGRSEVTGY